MKYLRKSLRICPLSHTILKGSKMIFPERKNPKPSKKRNRAAERTEKVYSFPLILLCNKNVQVPAAPNPVRARAIAADVKLPKPSILNTRMREISKARREEEMKKMESW